MIRLKAKVKTTGLMVAMLFALGMTLGLPASYAAGKYPTKAVTVIHGFKPGGGSDQRGSRTVSFVRPLLSTPAGRNVSPADGIDRSLLQIC